MKVTWCCGRHRHSQLRAAICFCIAVTEYGLALSSQQQHPRSLFQNRLIRVRQGFTVPRCIDGFQPSKRAATKLLGCPIKLRGTLYLHREQF
ncbi:hypothetical protein TNCV_4511871 [Trichonephila clavipes]|nr:hypothetical protein TNCV_4511871 [Trichonephila clavipes]